MPEARRWWLIPGTLCDASVFAPFLDALGVPLHSRNLIMLDRPAVGDYRDQLQDAVKGHDIVCGFSLGAIMVAHHADILPRGATLILFSATPMPDDPSKAEGRAHMRELVLQIGGAAAMRQLSPALFAANPAAILDTIATMAERTAPNIEPQTQLALSRPGALAALHASKAQVIALSGGRDTQTPAELAARIADAAPNGTAVTLDGLGHYALLEGSELCAEAVRGAMEQNGEIHVR
ncbi:MAG: alpha/beta hydrolase [Pseudomonadota bacterium]